jgi:hypothetical protein
VRETGEIAVSDKADLSLMPLMRAQMQHEYELAHASKDARIDLLRRVLSGIAANGTACTCCQMMNEIAREALDRDDKLKETK